jgi:hypothetical protein
MPAATKRKGGAGHVNKSTSKPGGAKAKPKNGKAKGNWKDIKVAREDEDADGSGFETASDAGSDVEEIGDSEVQEQVRWRMPSCVASSSTRALCLISSARIPPLVANPFPDPQPHLLSPSSPPPTSWGFRR